MSNINWLNSTTVTRSASVVRVHGFGMGDVCPMAAGFAAGTVKRHATNAVKATTPGSGQPWSPPVT